MKVVQKSLISMGMRTPALVTSTCCTMIAVKEVRHMEGMGLMIRQRRSSSEVKEEPGYTHLATWRVSQVSLLSPATPEVRMGDLVVCNLLVY